MAKHTPRRLTKERGAVRHDDRVEILVEAQSYWTKNLGFRTENAEEEHTAKQKGEMVKESSVR